MAQPIHAASLFACGFIARLIGGWLFGQQGIAADAAKR